MDGDQMKDGDKLDEEYLQILRIIKPYITCIMNSRYIDLIRMWLEKLSDAKLKDKKLRNAYLERFCKQIEDGVLEEPFMDPPTKDNLMPLNETYNNKPSSSRPKNYLIAKQLEQKNKQNVPPLNLHSPNRADFDYYIPLKANVITKSKNKMSHGPIKVQNINVLKPRKRKSKKTVCIKPAADEFNEFNDAAFEKYTSYDCDCIVDRWRNEFNTICCEGMSSNESSEPQKDYFSKPVQAQEAIQNSGKKCSPRHDEDSSWLDVSEESAFIPEDYDMSTGEGLSGNFSDKTSGGTLPKDPEMKINDLMRIINELRIENTALSEIADKYDVNQQSTSLLNEVQELKTRLQEVINLKLELQNSHYNVKSEWQNTIVNLHKKLVLLQQKNLELKSVISNLEIKVKDQHNEQTTAPKKCLIITEMHKKEVELMKNRHMDDIQKLERKYMEQIAEKAKEHNNKIIELKAWYDKKNLDDQEDTEKYIREYYIEQVDRIKNEFEIQAKEFYDEKCKKMSEEKEITLKKMYDAKFCNDDNKLKAFYEVKMDDLKAEFATEIKHKEEEIVRLEGLVQEQCGRMQEEVQIIKDQLECGVSNNECEDVLFLQKCIIKMDKLYKRTEKEFQKQTAKMRREIELRDKQNQIQLTSQRVNLISTSSLTRHKEVDNIISKLEEHYRMLLIKQHGEAIQDKKNDLQIIADLKEKLACL